MNVIYRRSGWPGSSLRLLEIDFQEVERIFFSANEQVRQAGSALQTAFDGALEALPPSDNRTLLYNARKSFFQKKKVQPSVIGLVPTLDAAISAYQQAKTALDEAHTACELQYTAGVIQGYQQLQTWAGNEQLRRALMFSSHDLLEQLPMFQLANPRQLNKKEKQIALALAKYVTRMSTRTTPLNRMATVGMPLQEEEGFFQQETVKITPNVALLDAFYDILLQQPVFYRTLKVALNPLITTTETDTFCWWYFDGANEALQESKARGAIEFVADFLLKNNGLVTWTQLNKELCAATSAPAEQTEAWLLDLTATGFLEWELPEQGYSPSWCGKLYQYIGFITGAGPVLEETAFLLQWLRTAARTLPFQPVDTAAQTLRDTADQIKLYFEKHSGTVPPVPIEQLFYEDVATIERSPLAESELETLAAAVRQLWQSVPPRPVSGLRHRMTAALKNGPLGLADLNKALSRQTEKESPAPSVPVDITGPLGCLLQPFHDENGQLKAVLNAIYPGGGKIFARWLHLFPAEKTEQLRRFLVQYPQLREFSWYNRFNANLHPVLVPAQIRTPGGAIAPGSLPAGALTVALNADQQIILQGPDGAVIHFSDPGLEELYSRPLFIQALLLAGYPRIGKELLPIGSWEIIGDGLEYRPRLELSALVLYRATWRLQPVFWTEVLPLTGGIFCREVRRFFTEKNLPFTFFVKINTEKSLYISLNSPVSILLLEKMARSGVALSLEEVLPNVEENALEIGMEFGG
jgi:hypothetical protein